MYSSRLPAGLPPESGESKPRTRSVPRNVWMLGLTSLLTDASSEMVAAVLPVYAIYYLRLSPLSYGVIDGLQQGGASIVKLAAGWLTDRSGRHKAIAVSGYAASAVSRLGLVIAASSAVLLTPIVALDRIGKGIRTAPRDAIISLSVNRVALATAFGVHRALDTVGAMVGPMLAFAILRWMRDGYDVVLVVSLALGAIAVAVIVTFVNMPARPPLADAKPAPVGARKWPARFIRIAASAAILGLASVSDSFIYLTLQRNLGFGTEYLPLLFVVTPAVYLTLAAPVGRLADRVGRGWVIVAGYICLLGVYILLASEFRDRAVAMIAVGLLGTFYAATDGVFPALASAELSVERRATGLAIVSTGTDIGRMLASLVFGWLWSRGAATSAIADFQIALPIAIAISTALLWPMLINHHQREEHA
jgi:MFS family permease